MSNRPRDFYLIFCFFFDRKNSILLWSFIFRTRVNVKQRLEFGPNVTLSLLCWISLSRLWKEGMRSSSFLKLFTTLVRSVEHIPVKFKYKKCYRLFIMINHFLLEKKMYCDMQTARCYNVFLTSCANQTSVLNVKLEHGVRLVKIWFVAIPSYPQLLITC